MSGRATLTIVMSISSMNVPTQTTISVHHLLRCSVIRFRSLFVRSRLYVAAMLVRELHDGLEIDQVLLIREVEARQKRDGSEFLKLVLADRTGSVPAMMWDGVPEVRELCSAGTAVRI